jgi:hypothetical protein
MQTDLVVNGQRVIRLHDQIPRIGMDLVSGDACGQAIRRQFGLVDNHYVELARVEGVEAHCGLGLDQGHLVARMALGNTSKDVRGQGSCGRGKLASARTYAARHVPAPPPRHASDQRAEASVRGGATISSQRRSISSTPSSSSNWIPCVVA